MRTNHWAIGLVFLGALTFGAAGFWLAGVVKHLWMDHLALHEIAVIEMQRQQGGGQK